MWAPFASGSSYAAVRGEYAEGNPNFANPVAYLGFGNGSFNAAVYGTGTYGFFAPFYAGYFDGPVLVRRESNNWWPGGLTPSGVYTDVDPNGNPRIELRGIGETPYIDFTRRSSSTADYDARLILYPKIGNYDILALRGASFAIHTTDPGSYNLYVAGDAYAVSGWSSSDARLKKNIEPLKGVLEKIKNINGVKFDWRKDEFPDKELSEGRKIGVLAQEVEKEFPELILSDNEGYKTLAYGNFTAVLLEAIKEQQEQIDSLKSEIKSIKEKIK